MSNGALPKTKTSKSSLKTSECREEAKVQNSNSEFSFELKPKPKLTCIPENCSKFFSDLRWVERWRFSSSFWLIILVNHFAEKHNRWMCPRRRRCRRNRGPFCLSARRAICTPKILLCKWSAWEWKRHTCIAKFWLTYLLRKSSLRELWKPSKIFFIQKLPLVIWCEINKTEFSRFETNVCIFFL